MQISIDEAFLDLTGTERLFGNPTDTAKKIKDNGYIIGAIVGFVLFFVITLISLILGNSLTLNTLFHFIIFMLSSMVGGIVGVNRNNRYI